MDVKRASLPRASLKKKRKKKISDATNNTKEMHNNMEVSVRRDSYMVLGLDIGALPFFDIFTGVVVSLSFLCVTYSTYFALGMYYYYGCYLYAGISMALIVIAVLITTFYKFGEVTTIESCSRMVRIIVGLETVYISVLMIREAVQNKEGAYRIKTTAVNGVTRYREVIRIFLASKTIVWHLKDFTLLYCLTFCVPHLLFTIFILTESIRATWKIDYLAATLTILLIKRRSIVDAVVHLIFTYCLGIAVAFSFSLPIRTKERLMPPLWISLRGICKFLWMYTAIVSKMIGILLFTQTFGLVIFVLIALQWILFMVFAMLFSKEGWSRETSDPGFHPWDDLVYKPLLTLGYTFTFVHPKEGVLSNVYGIYFLLSFLLTLWMMYSSYGKQEILIDIVLLTKGVVACVCSSLFHFIRSCIDANWPRREIVYMPENFILETVV